ncbi:fused MFS/spermidine synthase [Candidatus Kaiserbacteria bacterium]|nr:fused MFS/spermidine synthase [Candidatus Kaiserbacteria bacterium]
MQNKIKLILLSTVFSTGAGVLIMEVAAVRLLAPYFGSSLYVLSSVLTVVLLALSMGYYYGGKLSDKLPYHLPLYMIITMGGFSLLSLSFCALIFLPSAGPAMPLMVGPLFFSICFFFIPALLLGIDSPYVIKLLSQEVGLEESGGVVGATFFWSTAGSITGSLASGFFLIPTFGLIQTMTATGLFFVLMGVIAGLSVRSLLRQSPNYDKRNDIPLQTPAIIMVTIAISLSYLLMTHTTHANAVYEDDGYYSHIYIYDDELNGRPVRYLKRDVNNSSAIHLDGDDLVYAYTKFAPLFSYLKPDAKNFLMLGGGSYTIPKAIHASYPEINIDVVEIEPSLFEIAKKYFRLPDTDKITNHINDARVYLQKSDKKYDVIYVDTFSTGHFVPPHLATKEYLELLKNTLNDDGVIIINFIGTRPSTDNRTMTGSFTKTVTSVFPKVDLYTAQPSAGRFPQNLMFVLRNNSDLPSFDEEVTIDIGDKDISLNSLQIEPDSLIKKADKIITDNQNPVESLLLKERFLY